MSDIPNRDELERKYGREIARLFKGMSGHMLELLEQYSWDVNLIPADIWEGFTVQEKAVLLPFLENVSLVYAEAAMETIGIGVDWALVNMEAATWAASYVGELVTGIDNTSRNAILASMRNAVSTFFETDMTMPDLINMLEADPKLRHLFTKDVRDRLGRIFGPSRASMIAITETTRAASEGRLITMREIEKSGVQTEATWLTAMDEKVCEICLPLNNMVEALPRIGDEPRWIHPSMGDIGRPPAHVNCRCDWASGFRK